MHAQSRRKLTGRQAQVLTLICQGYTNKAIAGRLGIATATVGTYRAQLMDLFGTHNVMGLFRAAIGLGILRGRMARVRRFQLCGVST